MVGKRTWTASRQEKENLSFDSYELAEVAAKLLSERVITKDKIFINVTARSGTGKAFYYLTQEQGLNSEDGYFLAGEFNIN